MKVWRSGTSECSAASARASSSDGRISKPWSAATGIQYLERVGQRKITRGEQHGQVVEDVGGFLGHALVGLLARSACDLFGLFLDLLADQRRIRQQLGRPRALDRLRATRNDHTLE